MITQDSIIDKYYKVPASETVRTIKRIMTDYGKALLQEASEVVDLVVIDDQVHTEEPNTMDIYETGNGSVIPNRQAILDLKSQLI